MRRKLSVISLLEKCVGSEAQWYSIRLLIERLVVQIGPPFFTFKHDEKIADSQQKLETLAIGFRSDKRFRSDSLLYYKKMFSEIKNNQIYKE